jgi:hypothetical protein
VVQKYCLGQKSDVGIHPEAVTLLIPMSWLILILVIIAMPLQQINGGQRVMIPEILVVRCFTTP